MSTITKVRKLILEKLEAKNSWGKNEAKEMINNCFLDVLEVEQEKSIVVESK